MSLSHRRTDRGSATAELAVALPAVALLLVLVLGAVGASIVQLRCVDAARAGARSAALGEADDQVRDAARHVGGPRVVVVVQRGGGWVTVSATQPFVGASWAGQARGSATAWVEP